jgi:NADPH:quinone reductase-like Zn-dependent oxidoreductase
MRAAVVTSFDSPPRYTDFPDPVVASDDEMVVDVLAVGLHPRVRSAASGSHYTSSGRLPLVPGVDAVARTTSGDLVYFVAADDAVGTMAERAVVDRRRSVVLPEGGDPVRVAAAMNPAMSSWVALRRRIDSRPGASVLVLGATGNAGQMAVQIAKHLGARRVVGAGRDRGRLGALAALGADTTVSLTANPDDVDAHLGAACADVDVVLDYLWGTPAQLAMRSLVVHRADPGCQLLWVQIGAVAGPSLAVPSEILRAANVHILGSGQGSVPTNDIITELSTLAVEVTKGTFRVDAVAMPLADIEAVWSATAPNGQRVVLTP